VDSAEFPDLIAANPHWFASQADLGLILPSEEVLRLTVDVPGRTANSMKQALPFALEEYLTSDIETVHVAHGRVRPGSGVNCAIIDQQRLERYLQLFTQSNIAIGWVVSQAQLLQQGDADVAVLLDASEREQVLVVAKNQDATVDRNMLAGVLNSLAPATVECVGGQLDDLEIGQLETTPNLMVVETPPLQHFTERFAAATKSNSSEHEFFNLLQGHFAVRTENTGLTVAWRRTLLAAGLWLCVATLGLLLQGYWFKHQADQRNAQNSTTYQALFPADSPPVTTTQLKRRLAGKLRTGTDSDTSHSMVDLILRTSAILGASAQVQSLRYREKQMSLTVDALIRDFDELDAIKNRALSNAMVMDVSDATKEENLVRARLTGRYL